MVYKSAVKCEDTALCKVSLVKTFRVEYYLIQIVTAESDLDTVFFELSGRYLVAAYFSRVNLCEIGLCNLCAVFEILCNNILVD